MPLFPPDDPNRPPPNQPRRPATQAGAVLKVECPQEFTLALDDFRSLKLPTFRITGAGPDNPVFDVVARPKVEGEQPALQQYANAAYARGAAALNAASRRKLNEPFTLEPATAGSAWSPSAPLGVSSLRLALEVEYVAADASGKRLPPRLARGECLLYVAPELGPRYRLEARPGLLKVFAAFENSGGPKLLLRAVELRNTTGHAVASLGRFSFELVGAETITNRWGVPQLHNSLLNLVKELESKTTQKGGLVEIHHNPRWALRELKRERQALADYQKRNPGEKLHVPLRVGFPEAAPVEVILELDPREKPSANWVGLDLGTSASTIIFQDHHARPDEAVPREQVMQLQLELRRFFEKRPEGVGEALWRNLLHTVVGMLEAEAPEGTQPDLARLRPALTRDCNLQSNADALFELAKYLEFALREAQDDQNEEEMYPLWEALHHVYTQVFGTCPDSAWGLRSFGAEARQVPSELELIGLSPLPSARMGKDAAAARKADLHAARPEDRPAPLGEVGGSGRFVPNPKALLPYLHRGPGVPRRRVAESEAAGAGPSEGVYADLAGPESAPGQLSLVSPRETVQAAWAALLAQFGAQARAAGAVNDAAPDQVVATFPANLLPEPRREIEHVLRELGVQRVVTRFDEAVAPAVFYFQRRYGYQPQIGPELFQTRCQLSDGVWAHHVLTADIGAGTSDISLLRLEMTATAPPRGAAAAGPPPHLGGRQYAVTPVILGATGRQQLGGNLLTLELFRVAKVKLARWLTGEERPADAPPESEDVLPGAEALAAAEQAVPTRYKQPGLSPEERRQRLERFDVLWTWAEALKLEFSGRPREARLPLVPTRQFLAEGLGRLLPGQDERRKRLLEGPGRDGPWVSASEFEQAARLVVERIVRLAVEMADTSLRSYEEKADREKNRPQRGRADELKLHSVVLSGRAAALPLVRKVLEEKLRDKPRLVPALSDISFESRYAKWATAAGAILAQNIVNRAASRPAPERFRSGHCELDLRIDRLFFYLPATFTNADQSGQADRVYFRMHEEFRRMGFDRVGRIRSAPENPMRDCYVYRHDSRDSGEAGQLCGRLDLPGHAAQLGMSVEAFTRNLQVRFEINHELELSALLVREGGKGGAAPANGTFPAIYSTRRASAPDGTWLEIKQDRLLGALKAGGAAPLAVSLGDQAWRPITFCGHGRVLRRKVAAPAQKPAANRPAPPPPPPTAPCWWSEPIAAPDWNDRQLVVRARPADGAADGAGAEALGHFDFRVIEASEPQEGGQLAFSTEYRLLLTGDGELILFVGPEPPYWEATDLAKWGAAEPGCVLRVPMSHGDQRVDDETDPFSGVH